jgi:hypothetical protein
MLRPLPHAALLRLSAGALLTAALAGCSFDKFDGRYVANVPPAGNCCPARVVMDVDGHKFTGTVEDCDSAVPLQGHEDKGGNGVIHVAGKDGTVHFTDINFTASLPTDRCKRPIVGNKGG